MKSADAGDTVVPDHDVCLAGMQECEPGNGAYPVSYSLGWHGGPHLIAPRDRRGDAERVRAIADGVVVYVRQNDATEKPALQYRKVRTDDGCVVIRHTTEIGDGPNGSITYFSIYLHLQRVVGALATGRRVYRKDVLGVGGQIYGQAVQMHFEIVCDQANLEKLVGRRTGPLVTRQGRTDAIYGDIWFKVPKGTLIFANRPHPYRLDDREPPLGPHPSVQPQSPLVAAGTSCELFIRMHYERGDCTLTTFRQQAHGRYVPVGEPVGTKGSEYGLYREALRLHACYTDHSTAPAVAAPKVPSPSAIYEMLRLGRTVIDTMPPDVKFGHWRKVATPEGTGWMNLNQPQRDGHYGATPYPGVGVFSDADFPHWAGWSLIDDDTTPDSLCDSPTIKRWLDLDGGGQVTHAEAKEALHNDVVKARMSKAICWFPIEWTKRGIDARWGWLMKPHEALSTPLTQDEFDALKAHIEALAFWDDIDAPDLPPAAECWHLPPAAFIRQMRQCAWLSKAEMQQLLPRNIVRKDGDGKYYWEAVQHSRLTDGVIERNRADLNKALRKYGINTPLRMAAFFAQATVETAWFTSLQEGGQHPPPVHQGWHGRGFLHLTVPQGNLNGGNNNYFSYFRWRGRSPGSALPEQRLQWRDRVENNPDDAAQSAGFYWVKTQFGLHSEHAKETAQEYADQASPNVRTVATVAHGEHIYYHNETARRTAAMVNIPGAVYGTYSVNSLPERYCVYTNALMVLTDIPAFPDARGVTGERPECFQRREPW
jgi:hydroxyethylthiazole kinase